jgi:transcriptional regulator with XRE-family HTH domain
MSKLPHPLQQFRQMHGLSRATLAKRLGLSRSFLYRIEVGERMPGLDVTREISAETGIPEREIRPDLAELVGA